MVPNSLFSDEFYDAGFALIDANEEQVVFQILTNAVKKFLNEFKQKLPDTKVGIRFNIDTLSYGITHKLSALNNAGILNKPNGKGKLIDAMSELHYKDFTDYPVKKNSLAGQYLSKYRNRFLRSFDKYENSFDNFHEVEKQIIQEISNIDTLDI